MTIIVADTTCNLPQELLKEEDISLISQVAIFREDSYHNDKKVDTATTMGVGFFVSSGTFNKRDMV